ncbi:MAG: polyphosphate kinase 2 family protein, partial [Gemmatimonadota bacterium]
MFEAADSPYLVPFDGSFRVAEAPTTPLPGSPDGIQIKQALKHSVRRVEQLQRMLYAQDRISVLLVFQAMDAAGKDSTIRAVMKRITP